MGKKHGPYVGRCAAVLVTRATSSKRFVKHRPGVQCYERAVGLSDGHPACWVHKNAIRKVEFLEGFTYEG